MIAVVTLAVFVLAAGGIYLLLERSLLRVILGFSLLAHAANLVVLASGGYRPAPPLLPAEAGAAAAGFEALADPLPQALVLTAIVISMALTIYLLAVLVATGERSGGTRIAAPPASDADRPPAEIRRELRPSTAGDVSGGAP